MDDIDTPDSVARYIKRPEKTLTNWRHLGRGPRYLKLEGGQVRYRRSDVDAWLASSEHDPRAVA